jgi:hypothetical protein
MRGSCFVVGMLGMVALLGLGGCSSSPCYDATGGWTVTEHCDSDYVGSTFHVSDDDPNVCQFRITAGVFDGWDFVTNAEGYASAQGDLPTGESVFCTGTVNNGEVVLNCNSTEAGFTDCRVMMEKQ